LMSNAVIFDPSQSRYAMAGAALLCSMWVVGAGLVAMVEDHRLLVLTHRCRCNRCSWFRHRHRKNHLWVTMLAVLGVVPAEGLLGGFTRAASPIGVLGFVLIAVGAYAVAGRVLGRK